MAHIYAMSDIHEELDLFKETLSLVDFSKTNQLILVGDYVDIHSQNLEILYFIKELQEKHPAQITVIAGNHELMLLEEIDSKASLLNDITLIKWLRDLPFYYETDKQIFVHAGIDEEAEELWKWGSEDYYFCSKYPHTTGAFLKILLQVTYQLLKLQVKLIITKSIGTSKAIFILTAILVLAKQYLF